MITSMPMINVTSMGTTDFYNIKMNYLGWCAIKLPELVCMPVPKQKGWELWVMFMLSCKLFL